MNKQKISLVTAILINISIIIGAGIFINPRPLTLFAGGYGFAVYLTILLLFLPVVLSIGSLASHHPQAGGLYIYAAHYLHPFLGFISAWSYFIGKTTSAGLLTHTFTLYMQQVIPALSSMNPIIIDASIIGMLIILHSIGVALGGRIQPLFVSLKFIPLLVGITAGLLHLTHIKTAIMHLPHITDFITALPLAAFALMGFEATCSIAHLMSNPKKNVRRAIVLSFLIAALSASLFQCGLFLVSGFSLATSINPYATFLMSLSMTTTLKHLLQACIFVSLIGGAFSIMTSNVWNLYTLAQHNFLPLQKLLTITINKKSIPIVALLCEGMLAFLLLLLTTEQTSLQYMAVFCQFLSYMMSSCAAYVLFCKDVYNKTLSLIALAALVVTSTFLITCTFLITQSGISLPFFSCLLGGMCIAALRTQKTKRAS